MKFGITAGEITSSMSKDGTVVWYKADVVTEYGGVYAIFGAATRKTPYDITWEQFLEPCQGGGPHTIDPTWDDELSAIANHCTTCKSYVVGETRSGDDVPGVEILDPLPRHPMEEAYL